MGGCCQGLSLATRDKISTKINLIAFLGTHNLHTNKFQILTGEYLQKCSFIFTFTKISGQRFKFVSIGKLSLKFKEKILKSADPQ